MSSANSLESSVERENVVAVLPRPKAVPQPEPTAPQVTEAPAPSRADQAFVGTLAAIASMLGARALLFLALAGAFVLAVMAEQNQTYTGLAVLAAYCGLTIIPLVVLDLRVRGR